MYSGSTRHNAPGLPALAVAAIAILYLLAGITGHDPWKSEDAIHIGITHGFATGESWLFPRIAGDPWPQTAPLYHWVAVASSKLLGGFFAFHDAARLATTFFSAIFLLALAGAAQSLHGQAAGRSAPLLAIGTLGLLAPLHEAQPAVAGLACAALAYWGAALILKRLQRGIWLMGVGIGLAFPAYGLVGLLMAIAVLPAPTFQRHWKALGLSMMIALPLIAAWPLLLINQFPDLWASWWQNEIAEITLRRNLPDVGHLEQLAWAAWPVLPIALWSLWLHRQTLGQLALPLTGSLIGMAWYLSGPNRTLSVLPLLLPLTLLAAAGADRLRRGAANAFIWFSLITFTLAAGLIWLGASAQALDWPPRIARNFDKLAPGHHVQYSLLVLAFALAITAAWLISWRLPRASWRPSLHWASGMTLMWALVAILWLSWLDHAKSYRQPIQELKAILPTRIDCIERVVGIGASQRAALDYFASIRTTVPPHKSERRRCSWRLSIDDRNRKVPAGWTPYWQGQRPSDRDERWYLDRRSN